MPLQEARYVCLIAQRFGLLTVLLFSSSEGITLFLINTTVFITLLAWYNPVWQALFIGSPYKVYHFGEWYRCFTQALIHANIPHLVLNMYALYSFGSFVENKFAYQFGHKGTVLYFLLYIGGIVSASVADIWFRADNPFYQSLGASSGVSAVILSAVLFDPFSKILFYGFISIPGWLYAIGYLLLSYYMIGDTSNVNHLAHLVGSLYGVVFTFVSNPSLLVAYFKFFKNYLGL